MFDLTVDYSLSLSFTSVLCAVDGSLSLLHCPVHLLGLQIISATSHISISILSRLTRSFLLAWSCLMCLVPSTMLDCGRQSHCCTVAHCCLDVPSILCGDSLTVCCCCWFALLIAYTPYARWHRQINLACLVATSRGSLSLLCCITLCIYVPFVCFLYDLAVAIANRKSCNERRQTLANWHCVQDTLGTSQLEYAYIFVYIGIIDI